MIWHTSDFHIHHDNIIRFDKRPDQNVEEMNARIVKTINEHVKVDDVLVYHGDLILNKKIKHGNINGYNACVKEFLDLLNCKNIISVQGNHDRTYIGEQGDYLPNWELWQLFQKRFQCKTCRILWSPSWYALPRKCLCETPAEQYPIYDIHPMGYELRVTRKICADHKIPVEHEGMLIVCTHYSHRVFNKSHKPKNDQIGRAINLYGHSHGGLPGIRNSFDVGFNIWNRPLSLLEILTDLMPKHNASEYGRQHFTHHEDT